MTKKDKIYIYIYISEFFVLIISLNASYGHNSFYKNFTIKSIWQVVNGRQEK